ncbi:uncharacterized protein LOC121748562 [Salvia splendens]|uniref:uncharacterized protein LOC121748562 n=1 Tax=Salvia splendens TaxID=180675 RepID=UPI001C272DEC|nr:uncharacterized protein LOC121748562 [Salvia splendens]XP_041998930.1 uncharacterized protein LOC121748562 [Salvia splendens]XP_041998931.1 uncharacterized protein LOC121748562 [Salvia splendens]XP_041998932.1 uncharacterized protein LOC121748562 [Salvia splendens]
MFSPEDVAWADSCLSKDPDMLDSGWNSLRDALFPALNVQDDPSAYTSKDSPEGANMDVVFDEDPGTVVDNPEGKTVNGIAAVSEGTSSGLSSEFQSLLYDLDETPVPGLSKLMEIHSTRGRNDHHYLETNPLSIADTNDLTEASGDGISKREDVDADPFWSKHKMEEVFLPTYDENLKDLGLSDPEVEFVFQESKLQQSSEDIFVIWDFDSTTEENDIVKQLNKALAGNPAPLLDDSESWIGLQDGAVDDIISGIADLSLSPNSDKDELA